MSVTFVQLISQEISQATSSLTFSTHNSILETLDSILDTRDSRLDPRDSRLETRYYQRSSIESRGSRISDLIIAVDHKPLLKVFSD